MMTNIYAMTNEFGQLITYTPMSPTEAFAMGGEAAEEMTAFLEGNPGLSFTADPDYTLVEAYWHVDGTLDMVARYVGQPCGAEGCQCESKPFEYFVDGEPSMGLNEEELELVRTMNLISGGKRVSLELTEQ